MFLLCSQMRDTITNAIAQNFSSSALSRLAPFSHPQHRLLQQSYRNSSHLCCQSLTLSKPVQSKPASIEKNPAEQWCQYQKKLSFSSSSFFKYILTTAFAHKYLQLQSSRVLLNGNKSITSHICQTEETLTQAIQWGQFNTQVNQAWIFAIPS